MAPEATTTAPGAPTVAQLADSGTGAGQVAAGVSCPDEAPFLVKPLSLSFFSGADHPLLDDPCANFLDLNPSGDSLNCCPVSPTASKPSGASDGTASPRGSYQDVSSGQLDASARIKRSLELDEHDGSEIKRAYRLVRVDTATGTPARPVTPHELQELKRILNVSGCPPAEGDARGAPAVPVRVPARPGRQPEAEAEAVTSPRSSRLRTLRHRSPEAEDDPLPAHHHLSYNRAHCSQQQKPGGPCDHCGATESPQWRRGPDHKPVLCNACGTRFRRTHQLGLPASQVAAAAAAASKCGGNKSSSSSAGSVMLAC